MSVELFTYQGDRYPDYLRHGNAMRFILPTAQQFCVGRGVDVGPGQWPFPGAVPVEVKNGGDAMAIPGGEWDYVFSSHCLEHLVDPIGAVEHWRHSLRSGGVLFLYLPSPDQRYWRPQHCRKHLHAWYPAQMAQILADLGFRDVLHGERDLAWSFACVGWKP